MVREDADANSGARIAQIAEVTVTTRWAQSARPDAGEKERQNVRLCTTFSLEAMIKADTCALRIGAALLTPAVVAAITSSR